jgi:hypothetical protein
MIPNAEGKNQFKKYLKQIEIKILRTKFDKKKNDKISLNFGILGLTFEEMREKIKEKKEKATKNSMLIYH